MSTRPIGMPRASAWVRASTKFDSSGTSVRRFRFWRASRRGRPAPSPSAYGRTRRPAGSRSARTRRRGRPRSRRRPRPRWRAGRACRAGPCRIASLRSSTLRFSQAVGSMRADDRAAATRTRMACAGADGRRGRRCRAPSDERRRAPARTWRGDDLLGPVAARRGRRGRACGGRCRGSCAGATPPTQPSEPRRRAGAATRARNGCGEQLLELVGLVVVDVEAAQVLARVVGRAAGRALLRARRPAATTPSDDERARRGAPMVPSDVDLDHAEDDDHAERRPTPAAPASHDRGPSPGTSDPCSRG